MRLWSIHPKYLDTKGLVALWRESLLAQKVLAGETKGYRFHPQLTRFYQQEAPMEMIGYYLQVIWETAQKRGYKFNIDKIVFSTEHSSIKGIEIPRGQLLYEWEWFRLKVRRRDEKHYEQIKQIKEQQIEPHPIFVVCEGGIASCEVAQTDTPHA